MHSINIRQYQGLLGKFVRKACSGTIQDVDWIMNQLNSNSTLVLTRYIDFALSLVENKEGVDRLKHYLFHGTKIQRNYASLYFNRLDKWKIVKKAYELGLIDEMQAYCR